MGNCEVHHDREAHKFGLCSRCWAVVPEYTQRELERFQYQTTHVQYQTHRSSAVTRARGVAQREGMPPYGSGADR